MASNFDHRSSKSSRSNRPNRGAKPNRGNGSSPADRSQRIDAFSQKVGPYRSKDNKDDWNQDQREINKSGRSRQSRIDQGRQNTLDAENRGPRSRSFPERIRNRRSSVRTSFQRSGRSSSSRELIRIPDKLVESSSLQGEVITYLGPKDSSGKSIATDMIWGRHSTQAALEAGRPVHRIWCTPEVRSSNRFLQLLRDAKSSGVLVEEVTWARLGQITNGAVHQGIAIQTAAAETLDLMTLIEGCKSMRETPLLLALDGLTDPQNLGAIVRSAEAFGAHGLVLPQRRSAGLTGSVAKVAAGALEHLPVARVVNLNRSLGVLKEAGYRVIGLAEEGNLTLPEADLEGPLVVVTGSEDKGISVVTKRHCDQLVRIPLRGVTPSLNASAATAVFLYEVARNGWMKGLSGQAPSPRMARAKCASVSLESEESLSNETHKLEEEKKNDADKFESQRQSDYLRKETSLNLEPDSDSRPFDQSVYL